MELRVIARIYTDFKEKFGIPRQSGLVGETVGKIVFEKEFQRKEALRGIEGFSHLWLIWEFSEAITKEWSPTVRPPRLGGNKRMGVFATRSPYRPNPIGLSSVKLLDVIEDEKLGCVLIVSGADILDGTPIYDIKPYLKYTDSHEDAVSGFSDDVFGYSIKVHFPEVLLLRVPEEKRNALLKILESDPRPSYKEEGDREYGMKFADFEVFFKVFDGALHVTRLSI